LKLCQRFLTGELTKADCATLSSRLLKPKELKLIRGSILCTWSSHESVHYWASIYFASSLMMTFCLRGHLVIWLPGEISFVDVRRIQKQGTPFLNKTLVFPRIPRFPIPPNQPASVLGRRGVVRRVRHKNYAVTRLQLPHVIGARRLFVVYSTRESIVVSNKLKVFYLLEISFAVEQLETDILITRLLAKTPVGARDPKLGFWFTKIPLSPEKNYGFSLSVCLSVPRKLKWIASGWCTTIIGRNTFLLLRSPRNNTHTTPWNNMRATWEELAELRSQKVWRLRRGPPLFNYRKGVEHTPLELRLARTR